jgi:fatty acid desaturase
VSAERVAERIAGPGVRTFAADASATKVEWPTVAVAIAIYGGFLLLTRFYAVLPLWVFAPLGAILISWQGSLQHETIHGHPTRSRRVNTALGGIPLSLWIPYPLYRRTHLWHHRHGGRDLADPFQDPESFYLPKGGLAARPAIVAWLRRFNTTLAGRMLIGPALVIGGFLRTELGRLARGDRRDLGIWLRHAAGALAVLVWTRGVCGIPVPVYLALVVYPGTALTLLRSFAEHRANDAPDDRTAVVEAHPLWGLLFLFNNLHVVHHRFPRLAWYELPAAWRALARSGDAERLRAAGMLYPGGYAEIVRRYLLRPVISVEHPRTSPVPR